MNEKTRNALKWIAKILNDNNIPYRLGGGTATYLYGSGRAVNDIDISVSGKFFPTILPLVKEYVVVGPKKYKGDKWDCETLSLNYGGQDIDLTDVDTLLMSKKDGTGWVKNKDIYRKYPDVSMDFEGISITLMNPRTLLEYKKELDGEHQEFDIAFLEKYIHEQEEIEKLKSEGYDNVWVYEAEPNEVDEEHSHSYDTKLIILAGAINITAEIDGVISNTQYKTGGKVFIPKNKEHSAKVATEGCRYIVAERHYNI